LEAQGGGAFYFHYDGMSIGAYIGDAIRNITGYIWDTDGAKGFPFAGTPSNSPNSALTLQQQNHTIDVSGGTTTAFMLTFDASRVVPTALENRPASISAYLCIKY
jgi:hypothetical protein